MKRYAAFAVVLLLGAVQPVVQAHAAASVPASYLDNSGRNDLLAGGVRMIPVETTKGTFRVWTKRIGNNPKIKVLWNKAVDRFAGDPLAGGLTHLELRDTVTGEKSDFAVDGAFVAIGHAPSTELFKGKLPVDDGGYMIVEPGTPKTAIPGVFACGDVMDHTYRQAVTAAGTGCMAALDAERFVSGLSIDLKGHAEAAETV